MRAELVMSDVVVEEGEKIGLPKSPNNVDFLGKTKSLGMNTVVSNFRFASD